jgi:glycosyltransferase involved in cell wall biosynthesis
VTPIRICHVIVGLEVGGAERALKRLVLAGAGAGYEQLVVSLTTTGVIGLELQAEGIEVAAVGLAGLGSVPGAFLRLRRLIAAFRPDVVQTWMYHADLMGGLAARSAGVRAIVWSIRNTKVPLAGPVQSTISRLCAWLSYSLPRAIVCVAETARQAYAEAGYNTAIMTVIPNGFDFRPFDAALATAQALAGNEGTKVIGCVGRWHPDKGLDLLVAAAAKLSAGHQAKFLLVGRGCSWDNEELAAQIEKLGLRDSFELTGERDDVPAQLERMDIFCMPSRTEGFPNGLAEAMAMQRFCVATNVGDTSLLLGEAGILVAWPEAEALSKALTAALCLSSTERQAVGQTAGARVRELFSIDMMRTRHDNLYRQLQQE